jgi:hypothetical protein
MVHPDDVVDVFAYAGRRRRESLPHPGRQLVEFQRVLHLLA